MIAAEAGDLRYYMHCYRGVVTTLPKRCNDVTVVR